MSRAKRDDDVHGQKLDFPFKRFYREPAADDEMAAPYAQSARARAASGEHGGVSAQASTC